MFILLKTNLRLAHLNILTMTAWQKTSLGYSQWDNFLDKKVCYINNNFKNQNGNNQKARCVVGEEIE